MERSMVIVTELKSNQTTMYWGGILISIATGYIAAEQVARIVDAEPFALEDRYIAKIPEGGWPKFLEDIPPKLTVDLPDF